MMHIAIACSSLCSSMGGSERAATNLANEMAVRGHTVTLLSLTHKNRKTAPLYALRKEITHIAWENQGRHTEIHALRTTLQTRSVDVFLSMQSGSDHLFWAMTCMGSGIPFICSERCDPVRYTEQRVWNRSGRLAVLSGADIIHELLPAYVESVPECFRSRVRVIPNAAPASSLAARTKGEQGGRKTLLYLARFDEQKRPLLLLEAFRSLAAAYPDWDLVLWGHGPQEASLRQHIKAWNLQERIHMPGICRDAPSAYAAAHIYCLPSSYEGFPNTVLEAMCAGLPVVGFAECAGVRDVIEQGKTGIVVSEATPAALADALRGLMADGELRDALGRAARTATAAYAPAIIYGQWERLFAELAAARGKTVMDAFADEPFASQARLSSAARREWLSRDFGMPMPYTAAWFLQRGTRLCRNLGVLARDCLKDRGKRLLNREQRAG